MSPVVVAPANRVVRYGAIGLSLLLHGALFASFGGAPAGIVQPPTQSVTRLSFLTPAVEPVVTPEVVPEIKPKEKKIVEPTPEPVKKVVKKKVRKKVAEPVEEVVQEQISEPQPVVVAQPMAVAAAATPQIDQGLIKRETERYLTEVMAHIEQHKWYPKAARRRGIEGEVHISFKLLPDGSTHQLVVEDGPTMLVSAARKAVEKALPLPLPPATIDCPLECEFRMRFNLDAS
ncbi:energy transducer TonB [Mariprofundus sp. KV]|uniref:energy transducer TonB n=1 Tax=Mariprofundus sp. KV TaxID=2608715 RepID=UPI0015A29512|nr:energy transducer TonB [Mariprofundus sp. KV]